MPNIRRTFTKGVMNKDVDERLLDDGYFRHAENIIINTSEGSDVGSIEKCLSNKQLTYFDFGTNIETIGSYSDEAKSKLYWFVVSDKGCYLLEYDYQTKILYNVLIDTRSNRVLNLKRGNLITGISKIISEKPNKDLLLWTDNNMEVCCINIERAKKYGLNGFEKEDIYLIKKPPTSSPKVVMTFDDKYSNNIEDKFVAFAYRYKYLDGEYSALSSISNYAFEPIGLNIDFDTNDNIGMSNRYNAALIYFNTGDKRVKEIQVLAKESNSNTIYIIENFNKEKESFPDNVDKNLLYSNNKLYMALPEKELFKQFDNIPKKAKSLATISNRLVLGNYTEGNDLLDNNNNPIKIDYSVSVNSKRVNQFLKLDYYFDKNGSFAIVNRSSLKKGNVLNLNIDFYRNESSFKMKFSGNLDFEITKDLNNLKELSNDDDFSQFLSEFNRLIKQDIQFTSSSNYTIDKYPELYVKNDIKDLVIAITNVKFTIASVKHEASPIFSNDTQATLFEVSKGRSAKSNRDYEVALIYEDEFKRASTALTSLNNSVHIPTVYSDSINKLLVSINNKAPKWAKTFKVAVKSSPLTYENIIITKFYAEDGYTWCKLEGNSKDKVKENDTLILKRDAIKVLSDIITVEVLEKKEQEKDFIKNNKDENGNDIIEESGTYIKIKPVGFSMNESNYKINQDIQGDSRKSTGSYPDVTLKLFYNDDGSPLELPVGSSVYLWLSSVHHPDAGRQENTFEKTWNINLENYNMDKWYTDHIENRDLWGNKGNSQDNYRGKVWRKGKSLFVEGTKRAMSGGRRGYLDAKIVVRVNNGYYVFETSPSKDANVDIFYQTSKTYNISKGLHTGTSANQTNSTPAIIELDFFNCYAFGEGIESYKYKDKFNANALNIDLSPTTTSTEEYGEVIRYADLTYSEAFVESTGLNGINSFNRALVNWKELDKQNGPIQKIIAREGNLLVFQTDKTGQVLYGKDAMYNADGTANVAKVPYILGEYVPYAGEYGMSHPESFEQEANRCYWADAKRGYVLRLSTNGVSPIIYGLEGWFKKELNEKFNAKITAGIDPYNRMFNLTIGDNPNTPLIVDCGFTLNKVTDEEFSYLFKTNDLTGEAILNYNITRGNVTIQCVYKGKNYVKSNVSGNGNIIIPIEEISKENIQVIITPIDDVSVYSISHVCPFGNPLEVVSIVLGDESNFGKNITNGYKWGNSQMYNVVDLFGVNHLIRNDKEKGIEGIGKFPRHNSKIVMQSLKDANSNGIFDKEWNRMYYLISDKNYSNIDEILSDAIKLDVSENTNVFYPTYQSSFDFVKTESNSRLYMIWDYRFIGGVVPAPEILKADFVSNNVLNLNVQSTLIKPIVKLIETSYRIKGTVNWSEVIFTTIEIGEVNINKTISINNINLEKTYEFRSRFVSYNNEFSNYTLLEFDSKFSEIPAPSEIRAVRIGEDKIRVNYKTNDSFMPVLKHSEVYYKKGTELSFEGPIINNVFLNGKTDQIFTLENTDLYSEYLFKIRYISNEGKFSEYKEVIIKAEEKPIEPEPEEPGETETE